MKLKFKNILLVSFLAIAGILGVSSALINHKVSEQSVIQKANAWSFSGEDVYIAVTDGCFYATGANEKYCVITQDGSGNNNAYSPTFFTYIRNGTGDYSGYRIYKGKMPTSSVVGKMFFIRNSSSATTPGWDNKWDQMEVNPGDFSSTNNCFYFTSYTAGSWKWVAGSDGKTMYVDCTSWNNGSSSKMKVHYWDDLTEGDLTQDAGTVTNCKSGTYRFYSASLDYNYNFLWYRGNYEAKTGDLTFGQAGSDNCYITSSSSWVTTTGTVCSITQYKKVGTNTASLIRTSYLFGGLSYQTEALPTESETGYTKPTQWSTGSDGTGDKYTPSTDWISNVTSDKILYAYYSPLKYNITYKRNNELSVADVTEQKTYGVAYTIKNPGTSPLNSSDWTTPGNYRRFGSWNTSADGTGTTVAAGSYTTNEALTLYYIPTWDLFEYSVNGGSSWVRLNLHNDGKPSDAIAQFSPDSPQLLPYHATLTFRYSHNDGSSWNTLSVSTFSDGTKQNNYQPANGGIQIETTDTIFLKYIYKDSSYYWDCWVPGITNYTIRVGGGTVYPLTEWGTSGGGKPQMKATTKVYGVKDQLIEAGEYGEYWRVYRNTPSNTYIEEKNGNLYFAVTGMYTLYLIEEVQGKWDSVYVDIDNDASATKWASEFMANVGCDASGTSLPSGWSSCASYYTNLSDETKNIIYGSSADVGGSTLEQALARYDYAVSHHGTLDRFVKNSSDTPRSASAIRIFSPMSLFGEDESNLSTIIIVVASSIALLSVTALSILVIKKRKNMNHE